MSSRMSTSAGSVRPAGVSPASAASSKSSGRMPSATVRPDVAAQRGPRGDRLVVDVSACPPKRATQRPVRGLELGLDEVHRGRADELRDEQVHRLAVEPGWCVELLQPALAHHRDAVAERHRLALVVRDVDRRHAQVALEPRDLGPHLHAQLRVEVRERLVHQERPRLAHDRPAHRDPLALPARERARPLAEHVPEAERRAPPRRRGAAARAVRRSAASARTPCCRTPTCAGRARSSGRSSRCRGPSAAGR